MVKHSKLGHKDLDKEFYSADEFSRLTGVYVGTVRRWLREGHLKGTKIIRKWLIPHSELERIRKT